MWYKKIIFSVIIISLLNFMGCSRRAVKPSIMLRSTQFHMLPGWQEDDQSQALAAFQRSCQKITKRNAQSLFSERLLLAGNVATWQEICEASTKVPKNDTLAARRFFEFWFVPYHVSDKAQPTKGEELFTGYYLPTLKCRLQWSKHYAAPIYALPQDWVKVDLGLFSAALRDKTIVGQVKGNHLYPYPTRKEIVRGTIHKNAKVLAWCNDKVALAFAQVQGSACVVLPNKKQFLIGYEGSNGRAYTALGKVLIQKQVLTPQTSSLQTIRAWLSQHPDQADTILDANDSYVFFRILQEDEPLGSQQVPLLAGRSLAVDKRYIPLGIPVWLNTTMPNSKGEDALPLRRLLLAQDVGGAIKGIVRGDIYWGRGEEAEFIAGHMKNYGRYWLLLPRIVISSAA